MSRKAELIGGKIRVKTCKDYRVRSVSGFAFTHNELFRQCRKDAGTLDVNSSCFLCDRDFELNEKAYLIQMDILTNRLLCASCAETFRRVINPKKTKQK